VLALGLPPYDPWKEERAHARKLGEKVAHLREELFAYEGTPQYSSMAEHLKALEEQLDLLLDHRSKHGQWQPLQEDSLTREGLNRDNHFFETFSYMMDKAPHPSDTGRTTHVDDNRRIHLRLQPVRIWRRLDEVRNQKYVRQTLLEMQKASRDPAFIEAVNVYLATHSEDSWTNRVSASWRTAEEPRMTILVALKHRVGSVSHSSGLFENALYGFYPPIEGPIDVDHSFEEIEAALEKTSTVEEDLEKAEELNNHVRGSSHIRVYIHLLKRLNLLRESIQNDLNDVEAYRFRDPEKMKHSRQLAFAVSFAEEAERKMNAAKVLYDTQIAQHFDTSSDLLNVVDAKQVWDKMLRGPGAEEIDRAVALLTPEPGTALAEAVNNWVNMVPTNGPERPLLIQAILTSPACRRDVPELIAVIERAM